MRSRLLARMGRASLPVLLLFALTACADRTCCTPLAYDDSRLIEAHRLDFRAAEAVWEAATGINLFASGGEPLSASYGTPPRSEWGGWTYPSGAIQFDASVDFLASCADHHLWKVPFRGVALHELGHAIGLDHSDDPDSPMASGQFSGCKQPTAADVAAVQRLWR